MNMDNHSLSFTSIYSQHYIVLLMAMSQMNDIKYPFKQMWQLLRVRAVTTKEQGR